MPHLVTQDGCRLAYRIRGQGSPTLVFIHGWCSNQRHWDAQMRHLGRHARVLSIDRRGHGQSDTPDEGYTADQHAADLLEILKKERVRSAVLVGHAGGVPTALALTRAAASRIKALVLIDSRVSPAADLSDPNDPAGVAYRGMVDAIRGANGAREFKRMYSELFSAHAGAVGRQAIREACAMPREIAAEELASLATDTLSMARKIDQRVLWITAGKEDEESVGAAFKNVEFGQTVGSGHFPQLEVPEQINAMIARFVATL